MDRSAVIPSMERNTYVRSLIHTPLKGLSKQTTNDLLLARLGFATRWFHHHCFMSNMGWWWQTHAWGMERVWNGVWNESVTLPDNQNV